MWITPVQSKSSLFTEIYQNKQDIRVEVQHYEEKGVYIAYAIVMLTIGVQIPYFHNGHTEGETFSGFADAKRNAIFHYRNALFVKAMHYVGEFFSDIYASIYQFVLRLGGR